jgi:hypothetical protein
MSNIKNYTVYYYRPLKKSGYVCAEIMASTEDEALELAHKKTLIYKKYLTIHKPPYE